MLQNVFSYMPLFQIFIKINKVNTFESPKGPLVEERFFENPLLCAVISGVTPLITETDKSQGRCCTCH